MSDFAIDLHNVEKTYKGRVRALRGVEMQVRRGEVFGLLGPNGAGKSTLVKIMMTVIRASRVSGTILGEPVGRKSALRRVGYLPEHHRFPPYLRGWQVLDFYGAMSGVPRKLRRQRTDELLEMVGMKDWKKTKVGGYSKGMRQRLGIAQSLMNDPKVVLLDEPTDGVDPVGRRDIRDMVNHLRDEGRTVFLNSHLLSELEMVCDRVAIMVQGLVRSIGTLDELTADQRRYDIEIVAPEGDPALAAAALEMAIPGALTRDDQPRLAPPTPPAVAAGQAPPTTSPLAKRVGIAGHLADGTRVEIDHATLRIHTTEADAVQPIIDGLRRNGVTIRAFMPRRPSLEDLFIQAVTDSATGKTLGPGAIGGEKGTRRTSPPDPAHPDATNGGAA